MNRDGLLDLYGGSINVNGKISPTVLVDSSRSAASMVANVFGVQGVSGARPGSIAIDSGTYKLIFQSVSGLNSNSVGTGPIVTYADLNGDGFLDMVSNANVYINKGDGTGFVTGIYSLSNYGNRSTPILFDANNDGILDVLYANHGPGAAPAPATLLLGQGNGAFTAATEILGLGGLSLSPTYSVGDLNADGSLDLFVLNREVGIVSVFTNNGGVLQSVDPTLFGFENNQLTSGFNSPLGQLLQLIDVNGDRSLDIVLSSLNSVQASIISINPTLVAENTFLKVIVSDGEGGQSRSQMLGAKVSLYNELTGVTVVRDLVEDLSNPWNLTTNEFAVNFYGLDPNATYSIAVTYPGNDQGVTVVTGRAGLGTNSIAGTALHQILDTNLSGVSAGGRDVIFVNKEDRMSSASGGTHIGTNYADWMVGDTGNDVFTPNGARLGEVGDTIDMRDGGNDSVIFQQVANLNTPTTVIGANMTAAVGAGGDVFNVSGLLTALGYSGARDAASVSSLLQVVANGTGLTIQANKSGVGFQDLVNIQATTGTNISGLTLNQLISTGHVLLGGLNVSGMTNITLDEDTAQLGSLALFSNVDLSAQGGSYAKNFTGGSVSVWLDNAYAEDVISIASGVGGVTVTNTQVSFGGAVIGSIDNTNTGVGQKLTVNFSFTGSTLTLAQQADAVEAVVQAVQYRNTGSTPPDYSRNLWLEVGDGQSSSKVGSLFTVTPITDTEVLAGARTITGTAVADTLSGSAADEVFVGYGGPVGSAGTTSATGDTLTGGGGADTYVYRTANVGKDTITDFTVGAVGTVAGADKLNLADLLKDYFKPGTSNLNDFVQLQELSTTGTRVLVDFNGKADGSTFQHYLEIDLNGVTLASTGAADFNALRDLLVTTNQQIILA